MDYFITYNHKTGRDYVEQLSERLFACGIGCWWLANPCPETQLDEVVRIAMESCSRCIVVWTTRELTPWQHMEVSVCHLHFRQRAPSRDPAEQFVVLRSVTDGKIGAADRIPLLTITEYLDFDSILSLNLDPITTAVGPRLLVYDGTVKPHFAEHSPLPAGIHAITGAVTNGPGPCGPKQCWIVLSDDYGIYVQQPRPVMTHQGRWCASNVHVGRGLKRALLLACGKESHRHLAGLVLAHEFGQTPWRKLAEDFEILDERRLQ